LKAIKSFIKGSERFGDLNIEILISSNFKDKIGKSEISFLNKNGINDIQLIDALLK